MSRRKMLDCLLPEGIGMEIDRLEDEIRRLEQIKKEAQADFDRIFREECDIEWEKREEREEV